MLFYVIVSSFSSFMPSHHYFSLSFVFHRVHSAIMSFVYLLSFMNSSCHHFYWLFLWYSWTPLTSITIDVMDPLSFTDFILLHVYWLFLFHSWNPLNSFVINDNYILNNLPLWHWWKHLNILPLWQQWQRITYLCHWCTHFDIGFYVFLLSDNYPFQHISSLC